MTETIAFLTTYDEAVEWIVGRTKFGIRPGLRRMRSLLAKLGNPEKSLQFLHVAGTNGKGSTCAYLTSILAAAGYEVGTFTSPYIERYADRMRVNGVPIADDVLVRIANIVRTYANEMNDEDDDGPPTSFEVSVAISLVFFAEVSPDFIVWETGLGGRLDSTNVVTPLVSIITNIGHDHMDILGGSLELVAAEKAGIIKAGIPVVCSAEQPEVIDVIAQVAKEGHSDLYLEGRDYQVDAISIRTDAQAMRYRGPFSELDCVPVPLNGRHQFHNAGVALAAIDILRHQGCVRVSDDTIGTGMAKTTWPGRLEMMATSPPVLLDGAHNPEGAEVLAAALRENYTYHRMHVVIGMLGTKDHIGYLKHLLPLVDTLIVTEPTFLNRMPAEKLASLARELRTGDQRGIEIVVEPDWRQAIKLLTNRADPSDLRLVCGTLYLISDVRTWLLYGHASEKGW